METPWYLKKWGLGERGLAYTSKEFIDVELGFDLEIEVINRFISSFQIAVAQPLNDPEYKDFRIIVGSSWVF
jgi:hypothetical protein